MTEAGKTTLEKAREFWLKIPLHDNLRVAHLADFADSLTAELQKENARLREALKKLAKADDCCCDHADEDCCAKVGHPCPSCLCAALSKEKAK